MNNDTQYLDLLESVLQNGEHRPSRAGNVRRLFGTSVSFDMSSGWFPLIRTRKMFPLPVLAELECFIRGTRKLSDFVEAGCNYWTPNAEAWAPGQDDVGRIYGVQWRHWRKPNGETIDQLVNLVEGLRDEPYGRRHILSAWNPGEMDEMCLPPCHMMAQFGLERDFLSCVVTQRSVDMCLGLPADMILYGALLHLICMEVGRTPGYLTFNFGDTHVYESHVANAEKLLARPIPAAKPEFHAELGPGLFRFRAKNAGITLDAQPEPLFFQLHV